MNGVRFNVVNVLGMKGEDVALSLCVLASGSAGNCIYVSSDSTAILIDAGLSMKETVRRLAEAGKDLSLVKAVCVTHEHGDHRASLGVLQRRAGLALYATGAAAEAYEQDPGQRNLEWTIFQTGSPFMIGDLKIDPFSVSHDSAEPVGFVITSGPHRLGIVTDIGFVTELAKGCLRDCDVLVIESNHDETMVMASARPWKVKKRILGKQGHLSNAQAAELVRIIASPRLKSVLLAHLSAECNRPEIAERCIRTVLDACGCVHTNLSVTYQDRISPVVYCG